MITETTNLDYLIVPLRMQYGDLEGSEYSEAVYRTALVNAVRFLHNRWGGKYVLNGNNIARNPDATFTETSPPIIETGGDEYALVLAATVILRTVALTSSSSSFERWSTPDLSYSGGGKERVLTKQYEDSVAALDAHFRKGLGRSLKRFNYTTNGWYPTVTQSNEVPGDNA